GRDRRDGVVIDQRFLGTRRVVDHLRRDPRQWHVDERGGAAAVPTQDASVEHAFDVFDQPAHSIVLGLDYLCWIRWVLEVLEEAVLDLQGAARGTGRRRWVGDQLLIDPLLRPAVPEAFEALEQQCDGDWSDAIVVCEDTVWTRQWADVGDSGVLGEQGEQRIASTEVATLCTEHTSHRHQDLAAGMG